MSVFRCWETNPDQEIRCLCVKFLSTRFKVKLSDATWKLGWCSEKIFSELEDTCKRVWWEREKITNLTEQSLLLLTNIPNRCKWTQENHQLSCMHERHALSSEHNCCSEKRAENLLFRFFRIWCKLHEVWQQDRGKHEVQSYLCRNLFHLFFVRKELFRWEYVLWIQKNGSEPRMLESIARSLRCWHWTMRRWRCFRLFPSCGFICVSEC